MLFASIAMLAAGCGGASTTTTPPADTTPTADTSTADTTAASGGDQDPVVYADCVKPSIQPESITIACGDGNFVMSKITWDSWGDAEAGGSGTAEVDLCDPNCADGTIGKYISGVTLSDLKDCNGEQAYLGIEIDFMDEAPKGFDDPYKSSLGCGEK
jgi:hypothetical protein